MGPVYWVFALLVVTAQAQRLPLPGAPVQPLPRPTGNDFGYRYSVNDFNGNEHSHQQQKVGNVVRGQYKVLLPDGRLQTVTYVADENGYRAKVDYTPARPGEATTAGLGPVAPPFEVPPPLLPPAIRPPVLPPAHPLFGRTSVELDPQAERLAAVVAEPTTTTAASTTTSSATTSTSRTTSAAAATRSQAVSGTNRGARRYSSPTLADRFVRPAAAFGVRTQSNRLQYPSYYAADSQMKFSAYPYAYTQY